VTHGFCTVLTIAAGLALATPARAGEDESALSKVKHEAKEAAHGVADAARRVGHVVRDDAEEGWAATRHAARKVGREIEQVSHEVKAAVKGEGGKARGEGGSRT